MISTSDPSAANETAPLHMGGRYDGFDKYVTMQIFPLDFRLDGFLSLALLPYFIFSIFSCSNLTTDRGHLK
jgi:hypothetical protein